MVKKEVGIFIEKYNYEFNKNNVSEYLYVIIGKKVKEMVKNEK